MQSHPPVWTVVRDAPWADGRAEILGPVYGTNADEAQRAAELLYGPDVCVIATKGRRADEFSKGLTGRLTKDDPDVFRSHDDDATGRKQ